MFLENTAKTWSDAQSSCAYYGGNLVTFEGRDELVFVSGMRATFYREFMINRIILLTQLIQLMNIINHFDAF